MGSTDLRHRPSVAVIGSGVAGITAAYVLRTTHDVTLFEADDRLGGHAHTHDVVDASGHPLSIDTGFIVHNERTYPTLLRLFRELGVATQDTEMSLSVRCDGCGLEYTGGRGLRGILPTAATATRPRYLLMLAEVARFHCRARAVLDRPDVGADDITLSDFLVAGRFSSYFVAHFMTPLIASVWSCGPRTAEQYPARYLFRFLEHHGLLSVTGSPTWRTVLGGSRTYVDLATKELHAVRVGTPIRTVGRNGDRRTGAVEIHTADDDVSRFDAVVVATHPDQALHLLDRPTGAERATLSSFTYTPNPTLLHTDESLLPRSPHARASWNYRLRSCAARAEQVEVTYDLSRLQHLRTSTTYLVSLNAEHDVDPTRVVDRMMYHHPQFTPRSVAAQALLPSLNDGVTAFAGAYHGWGFHEDGARSGLVAAESLGGSW